MAGFLVIGLSIPHAFGGDGARGRDGLALGLGYLLVVVRPQRPLPARQPEHLADPAVQPRVRAAADHRGPDTVPRRVRTVGGGARAAGASPRCSSGSPAGSRSSLTHFVERHGSLLIVAFGESVADVGIGAGGQRVTVSLALSAALGLALTASLWWAFFGTADDDRAARSLARADRAERPRLVLAAYFYAYIPMLLGIVAIAAGLKTAIGHPGATLTAGPAVALAGGVTLFLAGDVLFRWVLRIPATGPDRSRPVPWSAGRRGRPRGLARRHGGGRGGRDRAAHGRRGGSRAGGMPSRLRLRHDRQVHAARDGAGLERRPQVRALVPGGDAGARGPRAGGNSARLRRSARSAPRRRPPPKRWQRSKP